MMDMNAAAFRLYVEHDLHSEYEKCVCEELSLVILISRFRSHNR